MAIERTYYTIDPEGKLQCMKCGDVPEELALGKVASVERALEDK